LSETSRVILLGASVRAAAESASRGGLAVAGVDLFGDVDTVRACRYHAVLGDPTAAASMPPEFTDAPVVIVGGLSCHDRRTAPLLRAGRVLVPQQTGPRALDRLETLAELARKAGMRFPNVIGPGGSRREAEPGRYLWKVPASSGGLAVRWQPVDDELPCEHAVGEVAAGDVDLATADNSNSADGGYSQQWVPGRLFGATFLSDATRIALLGVCRGSFTRKADRPFVYAGSAGPCPLSAPLHDQLVALGRVCVTDHGVRGLFNADVIVDREERCWLLEINPRWSASAELIEAAMRTSGELAADNSLFRLHWLALNGAVDEVRETIDRGERLPVTRNHWFWKRVVYATRSGKFDSRRLSVLRQRFQSDRCRIADVPADGSAVRPGQPLLTLLARRAGGQPLPGQLVRSWIATVRDCLRQ